MTREAKRFSELQLAAFLDGEADDDLINDITAAMDTDPDLVARIEALDAPVQALRAAFDLDALNAPALPAHPPAHTPADMPANLATKPRFGLKHIAMPAALAASFALGLFVAPQQQQQPATAPAPVGWIDQVASYQALYVTETLAGDPQDPAVTQAAILQARAALAFNFDTAPTMEGLTFKRAQMLAVKGKPLVQLAYLDDAGTPFALCITRVGNDDRGTKTKMSHDLAAASWVQDGLGYVLIGGADSARVTGLAERLQQTL